MQNSKRIKKIMLWLAGITGLVLAGTVAVTQIRKASKYNITNSKAIVKDTVVSYTQDEDSVEVIGTLTDDDPWQEVKKLVAAYYGNSGMFYRGTMRVIDGNQETERVIEEQPFEYSMLNNDYHYRLANMEMVSRKNMLLAVDHNDRTISVAPNIATGHTNKAFDIRAFKKIMEKGEAQARVARLGAEKILTIDHIADPDIQGYRIHYSPANYRIQKMLIGMARLEPLEEEKEVNTGDDGTVDTYYYYLEVLFTQTQPLGLKEKDFNPEKKFIEVRDGRWSLTPPFKEYQLLNGHEE